MTFKSIWEVLRQIARAKNSGNPIWKDIDEWPFEKLNHHFGTTSSSSIESAANQIKVVVDSDKGMVSE